MKITKMHTIALRCLQKSANGSATRSKLSGTLNNAGCKGVERATVISDLLKAEMVEIHYQYNGRPGSKTGYMSITERGIKALDADKKSPETSQG